jgi:hypothetical protein
MFRRIAPDKRGFRQLAPHDEKPTYRDLASCNRSNGLGTDTLVGARRQDNLTSMNLRTGSCIRAILLTVLGVGVLAFGCGRPSIDDLTVWKAEVPSPDGAWIASARTIQNGGFGSASVDTGVELRRTGEASQSPVAVLHFDGGGPINRPYVLDDVANGGSITMKWLTPSHLEVGYNPRYVTDPDHLADLPGIEISVQVEYPRPTGNLSP